MPTLVECDRLWLKDKETFGWRLPPCAPAWLRLPVIRVLRAYFVRLAVARHRAFWDAFGRPQSGYDDWVLYAIARGWC